MAIGARSGVDHGEEHFTPILNVTCICWKDTAVFAWNLFHALDLLTFYEPGCGDQVFRQSW